MSSRHGAKKVCRVPEKAEEVVEIAGGAQGGGIGLGVPDSPPSASLAAADAPSTAASTVHRQCNPAAAGAASGEAGSSSASLSASADAVAVRHRRDPVVASDLSGEGFEAAGAAESEIGMVCRWGGSGAASFREELSVMSVLFNVHEFDLSAGFMRFFTTKEACELRLVHGEFCEAVAATPWRDARTRISGLIAAWRSCFPNAQAASVRHRNDLVDADFVHFRGLRDLDMAHCFGKVSDVAFVNLRGIDSLGMNKCRLSGITPSFLTHLKGIQELDLRVHDLPFSDEDVESLSGARSVSVNDDSL